MATLMIGLALGPISSAQDIPSLPIVTLPDPQQLLQQAQNSTGLLFEKNMGQWDSKALFRAQAPGYDAFLTNTGMTMVQMETPAPMPPHMGYPELNADQPPINYWATMMSLEGANPFPLALTDIPNPYYTNYFIGNDSLQWQSRVPHYHQITFFNVYPGIDMTYYATMHGDLKYDFVVHPGANASQIQQRFEGAKIFLDSNGELILETGLGIIRQGLPLTKQSNGVNVSNHYIVRNNTVTFNVGLYDGTQNLIIDPLVYSTYIGGSASDNARSISLDSNVNTIVVGYTSSTNYPTTSGAYQVSGAYDVFATKLNNAGSTLIYSTYIGGNANSDFGMGMSSDSADNIYITGYTGSTNYPTTSGAYRTTYTGGTWDVFVTKMNSAGSGLTYSTFLGGNDYDTGWGIDVDSSGNAYVTGYVTSTNFPTTSGAYQTTYAGGTYDVFATKINAAGSALAYSTYLGGSANDYGQGVAVDSSGNAYISGWTYSTNYPTTTGVFQTTNRGGTDVFVTKLNSAGSGLVYSTYIGGSGGDASYAIALDSTGNSYVTGVAAPNFPTTIGSYQTSTVWGDGFVAKLNGIGSNLVYSTYIGGGSDDYFMGLSVDSSGNTFIAGYTASTDYPITAGAQQTTKAGGTYDAIATRLNSAGSALMYSTYLGGNSEDWGYSIISDSNGYSYLVGNTLSSNFPATSGAYQTSSAGNNDVFVSKIPSFNVPSAPPVLSAACASPKGTRLTWTTPSNNGNPISSYNVFRSSDGTSFTQIGSTTTDSYTDIPVYRTAVYFYRVTAVNAAGEGPPASTSYAPCDGELPVVSGNPITLGWTNAYPTFSGVSWQDTYSGLAATMKYSVGTSSGASNVWPLGNIANQPTPGTTNPFQPPNWTPGALVNGANYVNTLVADQRGNSLTTNGVYIVQYDNAVPTTGTISWPGISPSPAWTNNNDPSFTWNPQDTGGSNLVGGTQGSQHLLDGSGPDYYSHNSVPYTDVSDGTHVFTVNVRDNAGNQASSTFPFQIDTVVPTQAAPVATSSPGSYGWYSSDVGLRIDSSDALSGVQCEKHGQSPTGLFNTANCADDTWTDNIEGTVTWYGQATDKAGNVFNDPTGLTVKLDKSLPTITDNQPDVSWTNTNPSLQVTFGDTVSGIQKLEYAIYSGPGQTGTQLKAWTVFYSTSSDGFTSYTSPWSADYSAFQQGDNYVSARVTDRANNVRMAEVAKIQWDTVAPSRANPTVNAGLTAANGWYKVPVGMYIDSSDVTSGINCEQHSNTPTPVWSNLPCPSQDSWTDATEGTDTWYGRAVDQASNGIISSGLPMSVDVTVPASSHSLSGTAGNAGWYTSNVVATVTGSDAVSGMAKLHTHVDAQPWTVTATSSLNIPVNGDGTHTLSYYAEDVATNTDGSDGAPKTATIRVDVTAPTSAHQLAGTQGLSGWYVSDVTATLTAGDATSGLYQLWYKIDTGAWQTTTQSSVAPTVTGQGTHTVSYFAIDVAGNADGSTGSPHTVTFSIDQVKPVTGESHTGTVGGSGWYTSSVTFTLTPTDDTSGVLETRYGINDVSTPTLYAGAFQVSTEGMVQIHYRSKDQAGNQETTQLSTVNIDTAAPALSAWTQSPSDMTAGLTGSIQATVSVDPGPSGLGSADFRYSYDNGATWSSLAATGSGGGQVRQFTIPEPSGGWWSHKSDTLLYEVRASDVAGNQATVQRSDVIQRVAPTVSIQAPASGTQWGHSVRTIQWTGRDLDHDSVTYTVKMSSDGGSTFSTLYTTSASENGAYNAYSYNWDTATGLTTGANYVIKVIADDGQATATAQTGSFVIDNTAPTVTLVTPAYGKAYIQDVVLSPDPLGETRVAGTAVTVKASASDTGSATTAIAAVHFYVDGTLLSSQTATASSGYYQASWNLIGLLGEHTVGVQSEDGVGNLSPIVSLTVAVVESNVTPP